MGINGINEISDLYFTEYLPVHRVVGRNKEKINGILEQDFYLNGWMENYELVEELDCGFGTLIIKNKYNGTIISKLTYYYGNIGIKIISNINNYSKFNGLGIRLINYIKITRKEGEKIELTDFIDEYNKDNKKNLKDYYKKQLFIKKGDNMYTFY